MSGVLRIVALGLLALGLGLAGLMLWLHWRLHIAPFRGDAFSPARWQEVWACDGLSGPDCAMQRAACARGSMVTDLLARHLRPGLARADALALLGPPQWQSDVSTRDGVMADCDHYDLGTCSGFGVDTDVLYVCAGPDGTIRAAGHSEN